MCERGRVLKMISNNVSREMLQFSSSCFINQTSVADTLIPQLPLKTYKASSFFKQGHSSVLLITEDTRPVSEPKHQQLRIYRTPFFVTDSEPVRDSVVLFTLSFTCKSFGLRQKVRLVSFLANQFQFVPISS